MFNYSTSFFTPQQIAYASQPSQPSQIRQTQIQQTQIQQPQIQQPQLQQPQIQQPQIQQPQIQQPQIQQPQIQQPQIQQPQIQQPQIQQPQIQQPQIQQPQIQQSQIQQSHIQQPQIQHTQIQHQQIQQIQMQQTQMQQTPQISHQSQIAQQPINSQNIINSNELTGISSPHFNIYEVQNPTFMVNNNSTLCQQNQIYTQSTIQQMPKCTNQIETISQTSLSQTVIKPTLQTGSTQKQSNFNNTNQVIGFVDSNPSMNKIFNGNNQPQWNNKDSPQIVDIQKQIQNKLYIDSEEDTLSTSSSTSSNFSKGKMVKCPVNSFMIFCSKRRKELSSQNPALTTSEVSVILGDEWTNMSEEEKNEYVLQNPILENELEVEHPEYIYTQIPNNSKKRSIQSTEDILEIQNQQVNYTSYVCSYPYNQQQPYSTPPQQVTYKYPVVQIKQSPNAFILFSADYRQKIKDENPDSSPGVISKLVGNAWKNLPEEEKQKYYEESKRLRNENNELKKIAKAQQKNLKTMNKTPSSGVYSPYGQTGREYYTPYNYSYNYPQSPATGVIPPISVLPPQKRVRTPKDPTQPKHPSSAFLFYFQDVRSQYMSKYSKKSLGAVSKMISEAWKKLTPEEKAKYVEKSEQDKKRYNQEMKVWQENNKKQTKEKEKEKENN